LAFIPLLHSRLLITLVLSFAALGLWGGVNAIRGSGLSPHYIGALVVGEATLALEGLLGLILLAGGQQPQQVILHIVYGIAALATLPVTILFIRRYPPRQQHFILEIVCLLVCGLALRSQATGHVRMF
jgi:hypothetical protein